MLVALVMQHLKNLKALLQYNKLLVILFIFICIYSLFITKIIKYDSKYTGNETEIKGTIKEYSINGNKLKITVGDKEDVIATYYISSKEEKEYLSSEVGIGKTIYLTGTLNEPLNNTIPNNFNYKKYLYNQGIYYLFSVDSYKIENDNNILEKIKDYLIKRAYNLEYSDYILVLVLGDNALISSDDYNNYQANGTSHLLAISGSHVTVLLTIFSFFLKRFKELTQLIILSIILIFFGYLTNFQAALNRAIIFFIINKINKIKDLKFSNLQVLFITAFILVFIDPFIIYDLGFIYSFSVCGGIMYYQDKITGNYFTKLFKLSLISFLFSLPISAYINYEVNILSILINMIFVPLISIIIFPLAIITFVLPIFMPIFAIGIKITTFLNNLFKEYSIFINIPKMSLIVVVLLFIILMLWKNNKRYMGLFIMILTLVKIAPKLDKNTYLYCLDVNQGDSFVLISPRQDDVIMIDTGGKINYFQEEWEESNKKYNLSANTIKFLKSLGITSIDYLILTHGDHDHAGEVVYLIDNIKVKNVSFNNDSYNALERDIITELEKRNIRYYQNIRTLNFNKSKLYFLNNILYDNENDNSIVLYYQIKNIKMLFMGDAGVDVEKDIIDKYNLDNITVLKVGHHGSKTSTAEEFVARIKPQYAIISVGRNNRYGHPNKEVLNILDNSKIYRTDRDGSVMFKISKQLQIKTWRP